MQAWSSFSKCLPFESGGGDVFDEVHKEVESDAAHPQHHCVVCGEQANMQTEDKGREGAFGKGQGERVIFGKGTEGGRRHLVKGQGETVAIWERDRGREWPFGKGTRAEGDIWERSRGREETFSKGTGGKG